MTHDEEVSSCRYGVRHYGVCLGPCSAILGFGRLRVAGARLGSRVWSSPVRPVIWEVSSA